MKRLFVLALLPSALSGCVVAPPYAQPYDVYTGQPYAVVPGYAVPPPVYGPPVYVGPPVQFSFGLNYWGGGGHYHGHHHGFGGHHSGFGGGWRR